MGLILLNACTAQHKGYNPMIEKCLQIGVKDLVGISQCISKMLFSQNLRVNLRYDQTILVTSFVDVKHLEQSSDFGRMMSEYISSWLALNNYKVTELKLRNSLYIEEESGEFLLSRELNNISNAHNIQAVVVGTYAPAGNAVYVSARVVQPYDGKIISSVDFRLPFEGYFKDLKYMFPPSFFNSHR